MFELFLGEGVGNSALIETGGLIRSIGLVKSELNKAIAYYSGQGKVVNNKHLLSRLLKTLPTPLTGNVLSWYNSIDDDGYVYHSTFGIIGESNARAKPVSGEILAANTSEIYYEFRQPRNFDVPFLEWVNKTPSVVVSSHGYTEFYAAPLLGNVPYVSDDDYAVIGIDIPLLYCQYHLWKNDRVAKGILPLTELFIATVPLTQAMRSFNDVSMLNRIVKIASNQERVRQDNPRYPQGYKDYTDELDLSIVGHLARIKRAKLGYTDILKNLPLLHSTNIFEFSRLPMMMVSRQSRWIYLLDTLSILLLLATPEGIVTGPHDRLYSEQWRMGLRFLSGDRVATLPTTKAIEDKIIRLTSICSK